MKKLKELILYRERAYDDGNLSLPSIRDHMFVLPTELVNRILGYLAQDRYALVQYLSHCPDPYDEKDKIPSIIYSDGTYIWDSIIVHWVRKYRVRLPQEFLLHVEASMKNPVSQEVLDNLSLTDLPEKPEQIFIE